MHQNFLGAILATGLLACAATIHAQTLINLNFGGGSASPKVGFAATGLGTNDFWNVYRHYDPKFTPGMPLVFSGRLENLKLADGTATHASVTVSNAPGVWGNSSGDAMFDTYIFSQDGSNMVVTLTGLPPGRYHFYLYGHADADVSGEQNSVFALKAGTNTFGPLTQIGGSGWKAGDPWKEGSQFVVFRDVLVGDLPVTLLVSPGPNGTPVLNGLQILSRGTSPPRILAGPGLEPVPVSTNLLFREINYDGQVSDSEARFQVQFVVESFTTNELSAPLFEGDLALVSPALSQGLRITSNGRQSRLFCSRPGLHSVSLELIARITRAEPWNQISFTGPPAAIAAVTAAASGDGVEMQLLSGTQLSKTPAAGAKLEGFLGADRLLAMRWQSRGAEVARKSLVTVDTAATAQVTPTVIKFTTSLRYEILQAPVAALAIELPQGQALTRIQGEQIRDWQVQNDSGRQLLRVEFIKPVEKSCALTLFSEQTLETSPVTATLLVPVPLDVQREAGSFTLSADDTTVEIESAPGLRQVNAPAGALAAWRFNARPVSLVARLKRIEPILKVADRATARLEESRLSLSHSLALSVEKAGIYALDLAVPPGLVVTDARGDGVEDWKATDAGLKISFASRVLGARKVEVRLEQSLKEFPERLTLAPLAIAGAASVTTQLGAASSPGIRLKTADLANAREVPVDSLSNRADELLAYSSERPDWSVSLACEKLAPRVVAEVFNLVTIGDGLVGGSATLRFGIINQGVQQFRLAVPTNWANLEFTGANIRRKELHTNVWTITLQDKAWGGYTLVVTYDYQFDPKGATLDLAGAHALDVERETGSLGVMSAASLKLTPAAPAEPLRRVDEAELSDSDRALCTRPLLLAYKYTGPEYRLALQVTRFEELPVLDAVADRTELTSVLTEEGQLLTQSSFMVKNNEKQFQRFKLPAQAEFWSSFVNGQPAKAERDGDWLLVPLPRDANRDQAFAVDIVYAQKVDLKSWLFPRRLELAAPLTDIPNTYAEWQLFAPPTRRLSGFSGNMTVASGTTYSLHDAWQQFLGFYGNLIDNHLGLIAGWFVVALLLVLVLAALRRGVKGALTVIVVFSIVAILAAMMLPALSRAKSKAQRISAINNLKQIGLAAKTWSLDNGDQMPPSFDAMKNELGSDKLLIDPNTGQHFLYVGTGKSADYPQAILAYAPSDVNGRAVLFADGSVQVLNQEKFDEAMRRDAAVPRAVISGGKSDIETRKVVVLDAARGALATPAPQVAAVPPTEAAKPVAEGRALLRERLAESSRLPTVNFANSGTAMAVAPSSTPAQIDPATGLPIPAGRSVPAQIDPATGLPIVTGGFGGGGGLGGGAPMATGIRPIRMEIPRSGQVFSFTKVLNAGREPLKVSVSVMRLKTWRAVQMVFQVCAFGFGLLLLWALSLSAQRRSVWMAGAAALVLWSVASLLIMWRVLHLAFIASVPALLLALVAWAVLKFWRRRQAARRALATPLPVEPAAATGSSGVPPVVPLLFLAALLASAANASAEAPPAVPDAVSIVAAEYSGTVDDKVAQFEASIRLTTAATNQTVLLFGEDVALEAFTAAGDARLVRDGSNVGVLIPGRTNVSLKFKLVAKLGGDIARRKLAFAIPPALSSRVDLLIDEPDADIDFPTAVSFQRESAGRQTRVQAVCGPAGRLELNWTPRVKRAAEIAATVFVQNSALLTIGGGVCNTRATLEYQVSQGELKQLRVQLPSGHRVLRVEGESIRLWEVKDSTLVVDLLKGVSPAYRLTVETENLLDKSPASATLAIPHALGVKRETGWLALRPTEEISLTVEQARDLQRVDAEEFARVAQDKTDGVLTAFRFLRTDFLLAVRAETVQPQIEAVVRNAVRLGAEGVRLSADIDYTIKRAGLFALRLALPAGYRLESVSGTNVSQWVEHVDNGSRTLEVTLKERTLGHYHLRCVLNQNYPEPPKTFAVVAVHPLGADKLNGFITVATEPGLAAKTQALDGLTEIPYGSAEIASGAGEPAAPAATTLAYKFIAPAPGPVPSWTLTVATETVEPWVRAEVLNAITLTETLVSGRTVMKYDVANAPAKEFRLRVPAAFRNVELMGPQIRRRDKTNDEWRVELQSKFRGEYLLTVTWELPKAAGTNTVPLAGIQALGVERETGFISLIARPPLQVSDKGASELLSRIDIRELPAWGGPVDPATVVAYRYLRPGYNLTIEARRFAEAEALQALIDSARLTTVVADDGQVMTEAVLSVRHNGRQHLEVELPPGSSLWSAFVAGDPVRPSRRDGKLLLPLTREIASDAPVQVELTFIGSESFPKHRGAVSLVSPRFDVPLKDARWDLFLPPDYEYRPAGGSMNQVSSAALPAVRVYSLSEYNEQQQEQEAQQKMQLRYGLQAAREDLSGGNLRKAVGSLSRAKARGQQLREAGEEEKDLKQVADDLRRAQSSNLLAAQNNYFYENAGKLGDQFSAGLPVQQAVNAPAQGQFGRGEFEGRLSLNDAEVAGRQWDKLEKAQQVAFTKVAPLRVNLPTRGLHYTFAQVLQTEVGKPMTVRLQAENTKTPSWTGRIGLSLLGFVALWLVMAVLNSRRPAP